MSEVNYPGTHVCTCGDCDVGPFKDTCKYEVALRRIAAEGMGYVDPAKGIMELVHEVLGTS